jgi:3-hydroxyisobutyrate dehydrogenase-like beta-hydroxyacid dehydrogenase
MAGIPISTTSTGWIDIYAATGLAVGTNISIQNQGRSELIVDVHSSIAPASTIYAGYRVKAGEERIVDAGVVGCFARCVDGTQAYIQEL